MSQTFLVVFSCFHNPPNSDMNYGIFIHMGFGHTESESAQHFLLRKTHNFCVCSRRDFGTSVLWISNPTLYQLSHPVTPGWSQYSFACWACLQGFSTYLVSAFPAHSTSFSPIFFSNSQRVECALSSESEFLLVVGMHFVSPWYDPPPFDWA